MALYNTQRLFAAKHPSRIQEFSGVKEISSQSLANVQLLTTQYIGHHHFTLKRSSNTA